MIRILASKFSSLNCSQSYFTFQRVYKISTNASVHYSKLKPEEIAEKKRKEVSSKSTKLYHFVHMKYHSIVTRLKIYPLFSTIFLAPISYFIQYNQLIPEVQMMPVLSIGRSFFTLKSLALFNRSSLRFSFFQRNYWNCDTVNL